MAYSPLEMFCCDPACDACDACLGRWKHLNTYNLAALMDALTFKAKTTDLLKTIEISRAELSMDMRMHMLASHLHLAALHHVCNIASVRLKGS